MRSAEYTSRFVAEVKSPAVGYSRAYLRFLAVVMIPVMLVILIAALQGSYLLPLIYVGFVSGLILAGIITYFWLRTTPGMLRIYGSSAELLTVFDSFRSLSSSYVERPAYVIGFKRTTDSVEFTIGLDSFRLSRSNWDDFDEIVQLLSDLHNEYQNL